MHNNDEPYDYSKQKQNLLKIAKTISTFVAEKDKNYGSSWRRRGGVGAFMIIARKWDRIEELCSGRIPLFDNSREIIKYDIFQRFLCDKREEGIVDDVRDLVGYLLVLLEYMTTIGYIPDYTFYHDKEDNDVISSRQSTSKEMENPFGYDGDD